MDGVWLTEPEVEIVLPPNGRLTLLGTKTINP
jgi:hypothetical protein